VKLKPKFLKDDLALTLAQNVLQEGKAENAVLLIQIVPDLPAEHLNHLLKPLPLLVPLCNDPIIIRFLNLLLIVSLPLGGRS
jgi:hypothetical protein